MGSKYDWSSVSKGTNFIFTDQDGDVFESDFAPINVDTGWRGTGFCNWWFSSCDPYDGEWQESLEERPK